MRKLSAVCCLLLTVYLLTGCLPKKTSPVGPAGKATPIPTKPLEESILERPFVSLTPTSDGHWVNLEIKNIKPGIKSIDYELTYFAGDIGNKIERGVAGSLELKGETSLSRKILFGSESCTVKCKYKFDENVSEGVLTLKLRGDSDTQKYESAFRLQKGNEAEEGLTNGDGDFKFTSSGLSKISFFLTISTFGVPTSLPPAVVPKIAPYAVFSASGGVKTGTVSFKTTLSNPSIYAFDGNSWSKLDTDISDGQATASSASQNIFILTE